MKILIVSEFFPIGNDLRFTGGVEARNFYVAKYLAKKHDVTILTSQIEGTKKAEKIYGFNVVRVGENIKYQATAGNLKNRINFIFKAINKGCKIDADVVEGTNFLTHYIAYKIARKKGIPAIAWYPDVWVGKWIQTVGLQGIFGEVLERMNLKSNFKAFIAISNQTKIKLKKYTKTNIYMIPCGVDLKEYYTSSREENYIITISRLAKYKNIKDLIFAFVLTRQNNKSLRLKIIGRGPEEKNLKSLVKHLHLEKDVDFLSNLPRKELIKQLSCARLFCLPSEVEGFGISIIEAAAAGKPYVVSNIPVFKEVTYNFTGGQSFELHNIPDLSKKISGLLSNNALYGRKSKEAEALASKYSWDFIAKQTESLYVSLKNK